MRVLVAVCFGLLMALRPSPALATPVTIDFESLTDGDVVTNQFPGLTFTNAGAAAAGFTGGSLNELEFPPFSGVNVIFDAGGPMRIDFTTPGISVYGYFTYAVPLIMTAYDASNAVLGTANSLFASNLLLSGDSGSAPNEVLSLAFNTLAYVTIAGDPAGGSFTLDDLTFDQLAITGGQVPEPGTMSLLLLGAGGLAAARRRRRARN